MTYKPLFCSISGLLLLLHASLVAADILDGGEVRFHGLVTDEGPRWTWQMASADPTWAVDTAQASTVADRLVFDLSARGSLPFLEGRLHQVADRGGPGFSPLITFSAQGQSFSLPDGGDTTRGRFRATVPVTNPETGKAVGQLEFTVEQGLAATLGVQDAPNAEVGITPGMALLTGGAVTQLPSDGLSSSLINRLSTLLLMTPGCGEGMSAVYQGRTWPQAVLASDRVSHIAAAYASSLSGFQLTLPQTDTPAHWQAHLSVTVTVQ